ncbi:hypothetical protein SK128_000347, partial [Halocaridina rubra]
KMPKDGIAKLMNCAKSVIWHGDGGAADPSKVYQELILSSLRKAHYPKSHP